MEQTGHWGGKRVAYTEAKAWVMFGSTVSNLRCSHSLLDYLVFFRIPLIYFCFSSNLVFCACFSFQYLVMFLLLCIALVIDFASRYTSFLLNRWMAVQGI
jgi:hypothetical protein